MEHQIQVNCRIGITILVEEGIDGKLPVPEEIGETLAEDAKLKTSHYVKLTGSYVLSDDVGFVIDALGGDCLA